MARKSKPLFDWDNSYLQVATIGAVSAVSALAVTALFRWSRSGEEDVHHPPAHRKSDDHGPRANLGASGHIRPAGRDAMRDPPREWDRVDEVSDQSFPASDPPNLNPHID